jgi:hypothetical protein
MATNRSIVRRHRLGELTHEQEMELWLGPSHRGPAFGSESERAAAWLRHRDRLMTAWARHGRRPHGWWLYESSIPRPRYDTEQSEHGHHISSIARDRDASSTARLPVASITAGPTFHARC